MIVREVDYRVATLFLQKWHYSPIIPKLTKHWLGCYIDDELVGVLSLGWGTRPKHTIQVLFPELTSADYFEIGKMAMTDDMPKNSESQMLSLAIKWIRQHLRIKFLFTWADGIVGKVGYVYQGSNFLFGGWNQTDTYVTDKGEKIHPRSSRRLCDENVKFKL